MLVFYEKQFMVANDGVPIETFYSLAIPGERCLMSSK